MLRELAIRNFAIIDDLRITFADGLSVLSGETGAGKSIIIDAVNLLLGSRANAKLIRTGEENAELEAMFEIAPDSDAAKIMAEQEHDPSEGLMIRRIISHSDRHKIYINGRLATMELLSAITENLASISGQHAHQGLLKEDQHLEILDQFANLVGEREKVTEIYNQIVPLINRLKKLTSRENKQSEHMDLMRFQKQEITAAGIRLGEDDELEEELPRLKNAEFLHQTIHGAVEALYSAPGAVVEKLMEIHKGLEKACNIDKNLAGKARAISEAAYQIEDISHELRSYSEMIEMDDQRMEEAGARLDALNKLKRKYGGSIEAVLKHLEFIEEELSGLENISDRIDETRAELAHLHEKLCAKARKLSDERQKAALVLGRKVEEKLASLKMSGTRFSVELSRIPVERSTDPFLSDDGAIITETGLDYAVFMIAPNVGEAIKPLASIASGGELSRVVLALKAILAHIGSVETVVFDEVDAGIGGGTAELVGKKLRELSRHHQVICITHLPQIARFGDHHFRIAKQVTAGRTHTTIEPIDEKERVKEIARMLGGVEITRATLEHAAELLKNR